MAGLLTLAFETATGCGSVALTRGDLATGKVLAEYTVQPEQSHSRRLLGSVVAMFEATGLSWEDLDVVAVSLGPGSFTGLRIGMAAAKGIALAAGLPLIGVPTLDALAAQLPPAGLPVYCLLDARKQQVYAGRYQWNEQAYGRTGSFLVLSPGQLAEKITEPCLVAGPGVFACGDVFAGHSHAQVWHSRVLYPRAALVGFCGALFFAGGEAPAAETLAPLYVRASEAELNLHAMRGEQVQ